MSAPGGSPRKSIFDWESGDPITSETCDAVNRMKSEDYRRLKKSMLKIVCRNLPKDGQCPYGGKLERWKGVGSNVWYCKGAEVLRRTTNMFAAIGAGKKPREIDMRDQLLSRSSHPLHKINSVLKSGLSHEERKEALLAREERIGIRQDTQELSQQMSVLMELLQTHVNEQHRESQEAKREREAAFRDSQKLVKKMEESLTRITSSMKELSKGGIKLYTFTILAKIVLGFGKLLVWDLFLGAAWKSISAILGKITYRIYGLLVLVLLIGFIYAESGEANLIGYTIRLIVAVAKSIFSTILKLPGISPFIQKSIEGWSLIFQKIAHFMFSIFQAKGWETASTVASTVASNVSTQITTTATDLSTYVTDLATTAAGVATGWFTGMWSAPHFKRSRSPKSRRYVGKVLMVKLPDRKHKVWRWVSGVSKTGRLMARAPKIGVKIQDLFLKRPKDFGRPVILPSKTVFSAPVRFGRRKRRK